MCACAGNRRSLARSHATATSDQDAANNIFTGSTHILTHIRKHTHRHTHTHTEHTYTNTHTHLRWVLPSLAMRRSTFMSGKCSLESMHHVYTPAFDTVARHSKCRPPLLILQKCMFPNRLVFRNGWFCVLENASKGGVAKMGGAP